MSCSWQRSSWMTRRRRRTATCSPLSTAMVASFPIGHDDPLFVGRTGFPQRRGSRRLGEPPARKPVCLRFVSTICATSPAPWPPLRVLQPKEVMARGGWSSPQMALRYEHATQERDRSIARRSSRSPSRRKRRRSDRRRPLMTETCAHVRARNAHGGLWRETTQIRKRILISTSRPSRW